MHPILLSCLTLVLAGQSPEERMRRDVTFLASPALDGRGNGTPSLDAAAEYVAASYRSLGLSAEVQRFPFVARIRRAESHAALGERPLTWGRDIEAVGFSGDGVLKALPLRFAGYGLKAGDYDDLGDLKGQAAVIFRKVPDLPAFKMVRRMETSLPVRIRKLQAAGAALVIIVEEGDAPAPLQKEEGPNAVGVPVVSVPMAAFAGVLDLPALKARIAQTGRAQEAPVPAARFDLALRLVREEAQLPNLTVRLPGTDPALKDEYIAVGAHMDHLGHGERHSMGGSAARGLVHPGADDNASGTAMVMELARHFKAHPAPRPIVFLHFGGEEEGLLGSAEWIKRPALPLASVKFMVNLDMVGRLDPVNPTLNIAGLGAPKPAVARAGTHTPQGVKLGGDSGVAVGGSDHMSFSAAKIPTFFFFTGLHGDYHRPSDTSDRINYPAMAQVETMVEKVVADLAAGPVPAFDPETAKLAPGGERNALAVYFGILPDFAECPDGFRIGGTMAGTTSEAVGLKAGDIIVKFGDVTVKNIYDYMAALGKYKPGEKAVVKWLRAGTEMQAEASLKGR